jgi:hypothetical protein
MQYRLDFDHLAKVYRVKFYLRITDSEHALLRSLFWFYIAVNASSDEKLFAICTYRCKLDIDIVTMYGIHEHFNVS